MVHVGRIRLRIFAANVFVSLAVSAVRQTFVVMFNPYQDLSVLERLIFSLQAEVYGPSLLLAVVMFLVIDMRLRPLFRYLRSGSGYDRARTAGLSIPWILIAVHAIFWVIGSTVVFAAFIGFGAPGRVTFGWTLATATSAGFVTGLLTALWVNHILLPAKRALNMVTQNPGEHSRFSRFKDPLIMAAAVVTISIYYSYMTSFYRTAEAIPPGLMSMALPAAGVGLVMAALFGGMLLLARTEDRFQVNVLNDKLAELVSSGCDLSQQIALINFDSIGLISVRLNEFMGSLSHLVGSVKASARHLSASGHALASNMQQTSSSVDQIGSSIDHIRQRILSEVSAVEEASNAVEGIVSHVQQLETVIQKQADDVNQSSSSVEEMIASLRSTSDNNEKLASHFSELVGAADDGRETIGYVSERIKDVAQQSESLTEANKLIATIAARTNLLAMNAAIEAAHAGEAGKGFAVVADEIRKLAENSSQQSKVINEELKSTQEVIEGVVTATGRAESAFGRIDSKIKDAQLLQEEIRHALSEQSQGSEDVLSGLSSITEITDRVRSGGEDMRRRSESVRDQIEVLRRVSDELRSAMDEISRGVSEIRDATSGIYDMTEKNKHQIDVLSEETAHFRLANGHDAT